MVIHIWIQKCNIIYKSNLLPEKPLLELKIDEFQLQSDTKS